MRLPSRLPPSSGTTASAGLKPVGCWQHPRVVAGVVTAAALLASSTGVVIADDWSPPGAKINDWTECLRAVDPDQRVEACTAILGKTKDRRSIMRAFNGRGNALCATADRCREAVPDFASAVKLAPDVAGYRDNLARALRAALRYQEALQESDRAIALAPKLAFLYVGKARALAATQRGDEAVHAIETAMAVAPQDAGLLEYDGKLLGDLRRYPESYAAFDRALQLQPTRAGVYVRRADVALLEGRPENAIRDLERYPADGTEADGVLTRLAALRASQARRVAGSSTPVLNKPVDVVVDTRPPSAHDLPGSMDRSGFSGVPMTEAAKSATLSQVPMAPLASSNTCNLYAWTPLQRCIEDYHNENDPLSSSVPNPRRWNDELAAQGKALAEQHPEITWDNSAWTKLASETAKENASKQANLTPSMRQEDNAVPEEEPARARPSTSPSGEEVDACNSARVLAVMLADVNKFKKAFRDNAAGAKQGSPMESMARSLETWQLNIHNIRQSSFDATNNVRRCAADFDYNFRLSSVLALVSLGVPGASSLCFGPTTYKIEKTLDNPDSVYVMYRCP